MTNGNKLAPNLQKQVDMGISGTDILHGELKNLMYGTETRLSSIEDGPARDYLEGVLDAYANVYQLTYQLSFAIGDRTKANG
jgi:hypothetical protein